MPPLLGHTVAITGDRRADELAVHLRSLGAEVLHGPVIRTRPLSADDAGLRSATSAVLEEPPRYLLATTGIGVRSWFNAASSWRVRAALLDALRSTRVLARGPKVVGALSEVGIGPSFVARSERTAAMVDHLLAMRIEGAHVAVQLPADPMEETVAAIRRAGARVTAVPVYEWAVPEDLDPARRLVRAVAGGRVSAVVFTSRPAVRQLSSIAGAEGVEHQVGAALRRRVLPVCIGPSTADELRALTGAAPCCPERAVLGALAPAVADGLRLSGHHHVRVPDGRDVVVQGRLVASRGTSVMTSDREAAVLSRLSRPPVRMVSRRDIVRSVWGADASEPAILDTTMARLRRRLRGTGLTVVTVAGRGYRLFGDAMPCTARAGAAPVTVLGA